MPQSTNLNTTPYFEDFDPNKKFHKVLFKPGVPLQARELTTLQSILQDQVEKLGSSIYKEGAMVIPGQVSYDLSYTSVLIEDEYFGLPSSQLVDFIVGKKITGQSSGVQATVVNALTSEQSEKGFTTLYVKYITASNINTSSTFQDDEVLIANESFSIGGTVISENTDFAKCITLNATFTGSSAAITSGVYFTKGYFVTVDPQEIILDQFGVTPSYKIGLQVLENIVSATTDSTLNDPSQGFSNFAAPGADRFKLEAKLVKKALSDNTITDFIELLRIDNGNLIEITNGSINQLDNTLENTLARRTFDESGNYEVEPYTFTKQECLSDGVNNGVYIPSSTTTDGNIASKDLFEVAVSKGKSYVLGYELSTLSTQYVDVKKARKFRSIEDLLTNTDGRGFVITVTSAPSYLNLNNAITGDRIVPLRDDTQTVIGFGLFVSIAENGANYDIRLTGLKFLPGKSLNNLNDIVVGPTNIDFSVTPISVAGGSVLSVSTTSGRTTPRFFKIYQDNVIKSVEDVSITDIRAFASGTFTNDGANTTVTINNVSFNSTTTAEYTLISANPITNPIVYSTNLQAGTLTITITGEVVLGDFVVFGPQTIANPKEKLLNYKPMSVMKLVDIVDDGSHGKYDINGIFLNLGVTRVSNIRGVYIGKTGDAVDDILPHINLTENVNYEKGEIIEGQNSGAKGRVISVNTTKVYFVYETDLQFIPGETITSFKTELGGEVASGANAVFNGAEDVKSKFTLNTGQNLHTFEYSSLKKTNSGLLIPDDSEIYVIFDFFSDINFGAGTYTTVNSFYNATLDQVPSIILENEEIYLSDIIDFRIDQSDVITGDGSPVIPYTIDENEIAPGTDLFSLVNTNYQFLPDGQVLPEGYIQSDSIEYYIPTKNTLYLTKNGDFIVSSYEDSQNNESNNIYELKNAMPLIDIFIPAYTRDLNKIIYERYKNNRYTMKDIGRIESRVDNVEYYTQLSLLESDTKNLFIPDIGGFNRLKNGFIVDNFTSHDIGDPRHPNYACSMDFSEGELRPRHYTTNVPLRYKNDEQPVNYLRSNFIFLNYTDVPVIEQTFASGAENVNPFAVVSWVGDIRVLPATDDWTDEIRLPETTTNVEGNFLAEALQAGVTNFRTGGFAPTQWNAWQTTWSSTSSSSSSRIERRSTWPFIRNVTSSSSTTSTGQTRTGIRTNVTPRVDRQVLGDRVVDITFSRWKRSRNVRFGARRLKPFVQFYPFFDQRPISTYVTPKLIEIEMLEGEFIAGETFVLQTNARGRFFRATALQPYSYPIQEVYTPGVSNLTINPYTREPIETQYSPNSTLLNWNVAKTSLGLSIGVSGPNNSSTQGGYLVVGDIVVGEQSGARARIINKRFVSTQHGDLVVGFHIPDPSVSGNPRWRVGESVARLTDSPVDSRVPGIVDSAGEGTFTASGTILSKQSDVLLVRNAEIRRDTVSESRVVTSRSGGTRVGAWRDPLAQSFLVPEQEGMFVTKVDTYFQQKDTAGLPITMEIRTMVNGYPSPTVLGTATLLPGDVTVSDDASAVTTFTFDAPVFVEGLREYCFAILTSSVEYKMWISAMGQNDLTGNRITSQPYAGVLFKSQNASTWTAHQLEDLKFKLYRAEFDISETPTIEFENVPESSSTIKKLSPDPIELLLNTGTDDYLTTPKTTTGYIKVNHENHGMHDPTSFVTIDGAKSGIETKLFADWSGALSGIELVGDNTVEALFKNNNVINGAVGSATNLAYIRILNAVYSYDPSQSTNTDGTKFTLVLSEQISGPTGVTYKSSDNLSVQYYITNGVPLTNINKTHSGLRWITPDSYQIFIPIQRNTTDNISFGGSDVTATSNTMFTNILPQVTYQELGGTSVTAQIRTTSGTSISDSAFSDPQNSNIPPDKSYIKESLYSSVNLNDNNYFENPRLVASSPNSTNLMQDQSSVDFTLTLSSNSTKLSPVIDAERISLITTANRVSNITGNYKKEYFEDSPGGTYGNIELSAINDLNDANYVTKLVFLQNPATALRIELAGYNPANLADIDVLVKVLSGEESDPDEIDWIDLDTIAGNVNERGSENFEDQRWNFDITDLTPNGKPFTAFQLKLRMRSTNQSYTPLIKDLRCIALA